MRWKLFKSCKNEIWLIWGYFEIQRCAGIFCFLLPIASATAWPLQSDLPMCEISSLIVPRSSCLWNDFRDNITSHEDVTWRCRHQYSNCNNVIFPRKQCGSHMARWKHSSTISQDLDVKALLDARKSSISQSNQNLNTLELSQLHRKDESQWNTTVHATPNLPHFRALLMVTKFTFTDQTCFSTSQRIFCVPCLWIRYNLEKPYTISLP